VKAVFWVLILAIAVFGAAPAGQADGIAATVARVKPSIVGIGTFQVTRRPPAALMGTGFVVGDGRHVLTNFHVVDRDLDDKPPETLAVFVGRGREAERRAARIVAADAAHDVAILEFDGPALPALELGDDAAVAEGDEIAFTGFPIGAVLGLYPATHRGIVAAWTPIAIPAIAPQQLDVAMIKRLRDEDFFVFQLDATAFPGNSGSPLYMADTGLVIGIVSSVFVKESKENVLSDPSGISYAIPIRYARSLMREAGVGE
jgi:S1-C subfamily serine protease